MTQLQDRTGERVIDRPVREPPARKAPPPKAPRPPRVGLPIRWIGWMSAVVVLGAVAVATWLALSPGGGEEAASWDLFTQEREAGVASLSVEPARPVAGLTMPGGLGIEPAPQQGLTMPGGLGTGS